MSVKILGLTTTYNVAEKIPYVMPYYERMEIDKLIIYDNYSTDNTVEELKKYDFVEIRYYQTDSFDDSVILKLKNSIWKEYKEEYDWCIVCDFDEVLYSRRNFKDVLKEKSLQGKTYLSKIGLNLLSREFPPINDKLIHENVSHGFLWDCDDDIPGTWGNKVLLFDIKNTNIEYTEIGAHNCAIPDKNNKPFDDDISFFHIKLIDFNYVLKLSTEYHNRIKKHAIDCYTNFMYNLENIYKKSEKKSISIDYYIDTPGKQIYPPILLLIDSAGTLKEGKQKIDYFKQKINKDIFYAVGLIIYNSSDIDYDYDELFHYGKSKGISTFNGGFLTKDINTWMGGYEYLFKKNMKFNNPWIALSNEKILNKISDPNFKKTLTENSLSEKVIFEGLEITRFNTFINEKRKTLGCYLIVKNEEKDIATCLSNLSNVCDEIVVVDTGSNDKTIDIINSFNNVKLEHFEWVNDFSAARNYAMSKLNTDYVFSIDADELLTDSLIKKINHLKKENFRDLSSINMYIELDGNRFYLGGRQIVKNNPENKWKYSVHEKLYYDESNDLVLNTNEYIIHRPHVSKSHYNKYAETYYNEINKGNFINEYNSAHYFYYLFFTLNDIDKYLAKRYLYNCFDVNKIKSNTENQGFNLWDCGWIDDNDYYLNTLIGGHKTPSMVLPYVKKLTTNSSILTCLSWCYENNGNFNEEDYINLAYLSYEHGLFNDFIKYTKELVFHYPWSDIGNNNLSFIENILSNLKNYNFIIDCTDGCECLPSTLHFISQYTEKGFILCDDKIKLKNYELLSFNVIDKIPTKKKNIIIKANIQHNRFNLKNIFQKLCYGNEPSEKEIYIK